MDEKAMALMRVLAAAAAARRQALAALQAQAGTTPPPAPSETVQGLTGERGRAPMQRVPATSTPGGLPPLPLPPLPLPDSPPMGSGALQGTVAAGRLGHPQGGPATTAHFNPNVALDVSQIEDRRGFRYPNPGPRPEAPPWFAPWLQDDYRQRLSAWWRADELWRGQQGNLGGR